MAPKGNRSPAKVWIALALALALVFTSSANAGFNKQVVPVGVQLKDLAWSGKEAGGGDTGFLYVRVGNVSFTEQQALPEEGTTDPRDTGVKNGMMEVDED